MKYTFKIFPTRHVSNKPVTSPAVTLQFCLAGKIHRPVVSGSAVTPVTSCGNHKLMVKTAYPGIYHLFVKNMLLFQHSKILIHCSAFRRYTRSKAPKWESYSQSSGTPQYSSNIAILVLLLYTSSGGVSESLKSTVALLTQHYNVQIRW